jgi:3-deoxy-D-manno-octulosonate 8-phosphate phosphatase (KDO 8-P phosphatase)
MRLFAEITSYGLVRVRSPRECMAGWQTERAEGLKRAKQIEWLLLDVDGVLTDGRMYVGPEGDERLAFHVHDGHGLRMWQRAGRSAAVITGRTVAAARIRCEALGIEHIYQGAHRKLEVFEQFLAEVGTQAQRVCFVGDELVDVPVFRQVGLAVAVPNAVPEAIEAADIVTQRAGGAGAVREVIDELLRLQGEWERVTARYYE